MWTEFTKTVICAAVAVGAGVGVGVVGATAAPAGADPSAFGTLTCSCQATAPVGSKARRDEITRGIRQSLADWSPGPPSRLSARIR